MDNWHESLRVAFPYKYDPKTVARGSPVNLPESRNGGYRIGSIIARDNIVQEAQEIRLKEAYQTSVFTKQRKSPRGIMRGGIQLQRGPNGGFYNSKTDRGEDTEPTVTLNELLAKQEERDKLRSSLKHAQLKAADVKNNTSTTFPLFTKDVIAALESTQVDLSSDQNMPNVSIIEKKGDASEFLIGRTDLDQFSIVNHSLQSLGGLGRDILIKEHAM